MSGVGVAEPGCREITSTATTEEHPTRESGAPIIQPTGGGESASPFAVKPGEFFFSCPFGGCSCDGGSDQVPRKTREIVSSYSNSTYWNGFEFREGDIMVCSSYKTGSTWLQQLISQLLRGPDPNRSVYDDFVWVDLKLLKPEFTHAKLASIPTTTRRFLKTHLPFYTIPYSPKVSYICIGRNGRDTFLSLFHQHSNFSPEFLTGLGADGTVTFPPAEQFPWNSKDDYFKLWLENKTYFLPFFDHLHSYWKYRNCKNVFLTHFDALKNNMEVELRRVAEMLQIPVKESWMTQVLEYGSFNWMKEHHTTVMGPVSWVFRENSKYFMYKGQSKRWQTELTPEQWDMYLAALHENCTPELANWIETGHPITKSL
ncbi:n-hydroxyarylamine sulfotransferase [Pelomyxa schiedti]|nr:n-hydroxyarylamine sulfotransferase [Pelomyxa schiedti]